MDVCEKEALSNNLLKEINTNFHHSRSIVNLLNTRRSKIMSPNEYYHHERQIYTNVVPNASFNSIKIPNGCYLRKFSPDGRFLLAFSLSQKNVELFHYKSCSAADHYLFNQCSGRESTHECLFDHFFKHVFSVLVSRGSEALNRECSLFTADNRYVIVGSSIPLPDDLFPHMFETLKNNESLSPYYKFVLEDYTLYIVDLFEGVVTDSRSFKCDKIFLSHNQSLSLCGSKLAVLSSQHQTVHLFQITADGQFELQLEIGRFCNADDEMVFNQAQFSSNSTAVGPDGEYRAFIEKWLNSLKQKFLSQIMAQAKAACTKNDQTPIFQFYKNFEYFRNLRIWKVQLVSDRVLLLKYTDQETVIMKRNDPSSQLAFFAFYDIEAAQVEAVFPNTSTDFLNFLENHADILRAVVSHPQSTQVCCVSNCQHGRALHMKFKQTITNAKHGGLVEATKRLLVQLPICSQSFSSTPYLDLNLFRYDDKWISALERPKPCGDTPVKFFDRRTRQLLFMLQTCPVAPPPGHHTQKRLVAYIFHPYEPFVISIQKADIEYIVNLHFRTLFSPT